MNVVFVVLPHTLLLDLAGPAEALRLAAKMGAPRFALRYVGPSPRVDTSIGITLDGIEPLPASLPDDAVIVVVGVMTADGERQREIDRAESVVATWLATMKTHRILTVCSGALIAARAGLLDGRDCTTHHTLCGKLEKLAPRARVLANRLFVSDGNISTSAGITAGIDLTLRFIAEVASPKVASNVARDMVVYMRRTGSDPQLSPWTDGRNHLHPALHRVQDAISDDPSGDWDVERMAAIAYTSPRHLTRLFREHVGTTPLEFLQRLRIALARELIAGSQLPMEQVAERAGFASARHMRRIWSKYAAESPSMARRSLA